MSQQQALPKAANFCDIALTQDVNHEIDARLIHIGPIERTKTKGTPFQKCILCDQGGNQTKVTIWQGRTGTALADMNCNKWLTFNLSASKYKGESQYGGFWQMEAPVITQAPPKAPLATQNPVASTIVPDGRNSMRYPDVYAFPVTPETQERIARSVAVEAASRVVAAMLTTVNEIDALGKMLEISDAMAMWIKTGTTNAPEPQQTEKVLCQQHGVYTDECGCFLGE